MSLFLSVGSNYNFKQAWQHLLTIGTRQDSDELQKLLIERYSGQKSLLFSKGRGALASGVKLATGGEGMVAVASITCYVVIEAIKAAGCEPLYIDSDPQTLQFNAENLEKTAKGKDVRAVIVQNTLGIPVDIEKVLKVAKKLGASVIEDLAHSVGGKYRDGREMGSVGDYTMLSFGRDKMIDTINGGALVIRTKDVKLVVEPPLERVSFKQQFRDRIYPLLAWHVRLLFNSGLGKYLLGFAYKFRLAVRSADGGTNYHETLSRWQSKLALRQIKEIDQKVIKRLDNQAKYLKKLARFSPEVSSNGVRLPLLIKNRDQLVEKLKTEKVFVEDMWYEVPVSPSRLYDKVAFPEDQCPTSTALTKHILNLPTHQLVSDEDIEKITEIVDREGESWSL